MRYHDKLTTVVSAALLTTALLAPSVAHAAELPGTAQTAVGVSGHTIAQLAVETTTTAIAQSRTHNALVWLDARLDSARARLDDASDARTRDAIADEVDKLVDERNDLALELVLSQERAEQASAALAEAEAAQAAAERAARIQAYGLFPVAGANEFIDSWGFSRSGGRRHKGADIMAATGTPVVAVRDGVVRADSNSLGGLVVFLTSADGTEYYYAHLDTILVGAGEVKAGDVIGTVGSTGNASGGASHVHFEIHRPNAVNPYLELLQMVR